MQIIYLSDKVEVHNVHNTYFLVTDLITNHEYTTCTYDCAIRLANHLNEEV